LKPGAESESEVEKTLKKKTCALTGLRAN